MQENNIVKTAVIDVGTLKSKFEVRVFDDVFNHKLLHKDKRLTVIGRDLDKTGNMIIERAINDTINALKEFRNKIIELQVDKYRTVATEAIRKANNTDEVLDRIESETSFRLEILDHESEAEIYFRSVSKDFPGQTIAVSDIGGGSVQVVVGQDQDIYETYLFKTGAYFLQEFYDTHFPTEEQLGKTKAYVSDRLSTLQNSKHKPEVLVYGSSNIIDFMRAMNVELDNYHEGSDHPYSTPIELLYPVYEEIIKYCYEDRMKMYPDEPYYMWSAENALLNIFQIAEYLNTDTVVPSNNNISSGILYQLAQEAWQAKNNQTL